MALKIPAGVDGIPTSSIPDDPAAFPAWFKNVFIKRWAANGDVRNAIPGPGISIVGSISSPATVSANNGLLSLLAQPYVLLGSPVAPAVLTDYRSIAAQPGVVSLLDGGARSTITIGIVNNGIGNAQLRQGAATSVIGNATGVLANVADVAALSDNTTLVRASGALSFSALPLAAIAPIANGTVIGNVSGSTVAPIALTATQITTLVNLATASVSGAMPVLSGSSTQFLNGNGAWATPAYPTGANPSGSVGLSAVNGSSANFMRADAAPTLSQAIVPTWTGAHTFSALVTANLGLTVSGASLTANGLVVTTAGNATIAAPSSGTPLTVNGAAGAYTEFVSANSSAGNSYGLLVRGGTGAGDAAMLVQNQAGGATFFNILGDGHGTLGPTNALGLSWATTGAVTIAAPSSGQALAMTGIAAGTAALTVNTSATTGTKTASMAATNKPGTNNQTTPSTWLPVICDGTTYYAPLYAA
jgi:hypothetical protein